MPYRMNEKAQGNIEYYLRMWAAQKSEVIMLEPEDIDRDLNAFKYQAVEGIQGPDRAGIGEAGRDDRHVCQSISPGCLSF